MLTKYNLKIEEYVDELFENAPNTKKSMEFKEELLANLIEKYNDLVESGMEREAAYNKVIGSIGNIEDLFEEYVIKETKEIFDRKKHARNIAISVMLYILSPVCAILGDAWANEILGIVMMFVLIACATGLIIYTNMSNPKYKKQDDTMVEEFKEWQSTKSSNYKAYKSIKSAITSITVAVYLIVSFLTFQWWITWIIFLIGGAVEKAVKAYFEMKEI